MMWRFFMRARLREARKRLAHEPSPLNFALLAQEFLEHGAPDEAHRVLREGQGQFPESAELAATLARVEKQVRDARLAGLREALAEAPRDGLRREYVELLLEGGQLERAEEAAGRWCSEADGAEARLALASVLAARFLADRGRTAGERAFAELDEVERVAPHDPRSWKLRMELSASIGAWREARRAAARLLELEPGAPDLETCFRTYDARSGDELSIRDALLEVERTGRLHDEHRSDSGRAQASLTREVRPALRALAHEESVRAALYLRGATALVQGPKGATAERTARHLREVAQSTRAVARRLGLGSVHELELDGDFGSLLFSTTEADAAVLWSVEAPGALHRKALAELSGRNVQQGKEAAR
jgi:hypothetical protein